MAAGAMRAVRSAGLGMPGDISVMGIGDSPVATWLDPVFGNHERFVESDW